ncbi:hypothetical protein PG996_010542 [Apiospora saccharicola]|uniref:2EXR domain-containing protein n=1 Tax=Apiospora saccharicola TaxID=335842 RepID=A0ABR1UNW6_9PEZI
MSAPQTFSRFGDLPAELQTKIWEQAIKDEHDDRVVPLTYRTGYVILTDQVKYQASKFLRVSFDSQETATSVYNLEVPVIKNGEPGIARRAALTVYNVALPVGIFSILTGGLLPPLQTYGLQPGPFVQQGTVRVSLLDDIFYVSSFTIDYLREKYATFEYADLVTRVPSPIMGVGLIAGGKAPKYKTVALTSAQRARIERVLEVHDVTTQYLNMRATQGQPVQHAFTAAGLTATRECFHVDNPFTAGGIRRPDRFLNHLTQGYTSAQLISWLNPDVCTM